MSPDEVRLRAKIQPYMNDAVRIRYCRLYPRNQFYVAFLSTGGRPRTVAIFTTMPSNGFSVANNITKRSAIYNSESDALEWSKRRGARSGRIAAHYITELAGRAGKAL